MPFSLTFPQLWLNFNPETHDQLQFSPLAALPNSWDRYNRTGYNFKEGAEGRGAAGARLGAEAASAGLSVAAEALQVASGRAGALLCPAEAAGGAAAAAGTGAHQRRGCGASAGSALPRGRSCTAAHR